MSFFIFPGESSLKLLLCMAFVWPSGKPKQEPVCTTGLQIAVNRDNLRR